MSDQQIENGYILLARAIENSAIWRDDPHVLKLFIYLVMEARHKKEPEKYPGFKVNRGELVTSLGQISEDNQYFFRSVKKWSRSKVSRMITRLEEEGYIKVLADTYGTHIKICNYNTYQNTDNYKRTAANMECNGSATLPNSSETQVNINNNGINGNNDKNVKKNKGGFKKPTFEEVKEYCSEKNYDIDPGNFIDFYESKGWMIGKNKMKSWKACVRTWVRNRRENSPGQKKSQLNSLFDKAEG